MTTSSDFVTVELDGVEVIADAIGAFSFHGGFIGFTATTGWATNFHRFDNLLVVQDCAVP